MKTLIADNNDSFTYNIVDLLDKIGYDHYEVVRTNSLQKNYLTNFDKFIISPGPGRPSDFPMNFEIIRYCEIHNLSLLGICLGYQTICEYYGGNLYQLDRVIHGQKSRLTIDNQSLLYKNLSDEINVGRYHSLAIDALSLPSCLRITGVTNNVKTLMSVEHITHKIYGIQYHPESFLTSDGPIILTNFMNLI